MLCWTSCSHNFVLLVVLYIVVVPPCYAFEPSVMCGNHQKVDNTEAAERLALVEPQLSPGKVVSLFDKFHTHTQLSPVTFLFFQCQSSKNKNCFCCPKAMPPLLRTWKSSNLRLVVYIADMDVLASGLERSCSEREKPRSARIQRWRVSAC